MFVGVDLYNSLKESDGTGPGLIATSTVGWAHHVQKYLGNPDNPSHQPEQFMSAVEPLNFQERLINTLIYSHDYNILGWMVFPNIFPDLYKSLNVDGFKKMIYEIDLLFIASHFITHSPQVYCVMLQ